jgi:hypothetical protein
MCFGPSMRFLHGADYTATTVARQIAATVLRRGSRPRFAFARGSHCNL